jgi:hypothetical protein
MISRSKAVQLGIDFNSNLYDKNRKDSSQLGFLYDLAVKAPDGIAVECGVKAGGSLVTWGVSRIGRGPIIAVDNRRTQNYGVSLIAKLAEQGVDITLLEVSSWDAPDMIDGQVAFCFIDADHSLRGIPRDVTVWPDKIMKGGILVFHDYNVPNQATVVKCVVDAWQAENIWRGEGWEHLGTVGSTIAFRR